MPELATWVLDLEPYVFEGPDLEGKVPYAPDFTPATLGKTIGVDDVLPNLLGRAAQQPTSAEFREHIGSVGLAHIKSTKNRADMASHVLQGLKNYGLLTEVADRLHLTTAGRLILDAPAETRKDVFATHILCHCNGLRLVEEIERYQLRGETPSLEHLAATIDRHRTSKSVSTMKAWLARSGVIRANRYEVNRAAVERLLGERTGSLLGLSEEQVEFLFAARLLVSQGGESDLKAIDVATLTEERSGVQISRKSLSGFVKTLEKTGWVIRSGRKKGSGGSQLYFRLLKRGTELGEEQLRGLLDQVSTGFLLSDLLPLDHVLANLDSGDTDKVGRLGEMLAIHVCLMLGLRVCEWRKRAPHAEIDLIAERSTGLTYQWWAIQVKNTGGKLDADQVDREIGAVAGSGVTHILFVVPRTALTKPAQLEILHRSRLTPLHIYYLTDEHFGERPDAAALLRELAAQQTYLSRAKREEIIRRQTGL